MEVSGMGAGFLHHGQELATIYTLILAMFTLAKHLQIHLGYVCLDRLTSPEPFRGTDSGPGDTWTLVSEWVTQTDGRRVWLKSY